MSAQPKLLIPKNVRNAVPPSGRSKASHTKTRTGCVRCKKRRIKCDESRPGCQRCQRAGEACPGYPSLQVRLFGLSMDSGFSSELDKKCFDSFISEGARRLSNFQPNSLGFWTVLLPQLSQIHLSLRHSVIALSLIHEPLSSNVVAEVTRVRRANLLDDIVSHYNRAIRGFATSVVKMNVEAKLACCFVFVALTMYLDRTAASDTHILAAYHFIQEYELRVQRGEVMRDRAITDTFIPVAKKMLIDACIFRNTASQLSRYCIDPIAGWIDEYLTIPTSFPDIESAWACLGSLLKCAVVSTQCMLPFDEVAKLRLQQALKIFPSAVYSSQLSNLSGRELPPPQINTHIKGLLLHHRAITIMSRCPLGMRECAYEAFENEFEMLFLQTLDVLQTEQFENWRVGMGYLPPLFFIATKCRSSRLRRQTLDLIHQTRRIERFWTSCMAYSLAKFVVDFEESSLQDSINNPDIPRKYVSLHELRLDPIAQVAHVQISTQTSNRDFSPIWVQVPCPIARAINQTTVDDLISIPVLKASGYSGILLCTGTIACMCANRQSLENCLIIPDRPNLIDYSSSRRELYEEQCKENIQTITNCSLELPKNAEIVWPS